MKGLARLRENKSILVLVCCTIAVYAGMLAADTVSETSTAALAFKYLGDICCLLILLFSRRQAYARSDSTFLFTAFLLILAADALFLLARDIAPGILCYAFAHLVLIRRYHGKAFARCLAVLLAALVFYTAGKLAGWQLPYVYILSVVYGALLFLDAFYGFHSTLPRPNITLVKVGMTLFILNDANNAIMYLCPPGSTGSEIAAYFVWVFYLPALALLSLSAYDYKNETGGRRPRPF